MRYFLLAFLLLLMWSCKNDNTLFELLPSKKTGIQFSNTIIEKDSVNPMDLTNIYNGGGVGVGDFNGDGLEDLYFTGNQVSNKLYLNKGDFQFEDITDIAGVSGEGKWCRGVTVADINGDGLADIYVSATLNPVPDKCRNMLYINQGNNKDGIPIFKDMAKEYGLDDTTQTTTAAFFDYDNDGDLDVYLVVNKITKGISASTYRKKMTDGSSPSTGKLFRNDWDSAKGHPYFTDVTKSAGVTIEGYGHSVNVSDFNLDGWKDIYVSNDFLSNDLLYINNHDGTFTDKSTSYFKHTSANGMGQDVIDINNDGLSDVVELDMNPEDNYRKKMMMSAYSYQTYLNNDFFGYQYQYVRNSLQLNMGPRIDEDDTIGDPVFSDVGFFAGISETDWSWTPLVSDFDNDGYRDIIISNGFPRDVTDHDFISFRNNASNLVSTDDIVSQIPQVKLHNYGFHNNGDVTFSNVTSEWGLEIPSFSNGAVYVDLDNDGDMDVVMNNINDEAFVYKNRQMDNKEKAPHYLTFKMKGTRENPYGFGAWISVYYGAQKQVYEQTPYRGYLSSIDNRPHFGLGSVDKVDSVVVLWPDKKKQVLKNVKSDQMLELNIADANEYYEWPSEKIANNSYVEDVTKDLKINYTYTARDYVDFNVQKLIPHKFTEYGPALAVGDIDNNGLDDIIAGGAINSNATVLLQQKNGTFSESKLQLTQKTAPANESEDEGIALFDADNDGDLDIYIAGGGYENAPGSAAYRDKLLINNGAGKFTADSMAIPANYTSKSCVRVCDYDHDGDLDIFIAGRVDPTRYPEPVSSFIYRNDTKDGVVHFTDVTASVAPALSKVGLVCDALWTDFDNDGWQDIILAGEWMPITFLKNDHGHFTNITATSGVQSHVGWWNSILPGDFDNDGDIDYIVGNLGLNSFFKASDKYPVSIYGKDFDNNGTYDAIPTLYLPTSGTDTTRHEYPAHVRDDLIKQLISFRAKYHDYKSFANATFDKMFTPEEMKGVLKLQANDFKNSYLRNDGNGKFTIIALPAQTQFSCLNGMVAEDINQDGNLDIMAVGNDFSADVSVGRYDACNGLCLQGDGKGNFTSLPILQSGLYVPGNAKALVELRGTNNKTLLAASQNKDKMKVFEMKTPYKHIDLEPLDVSATIEYKDGRKQKKEFYYGNSFLSQSARFLNVDENVSSVSITNSVGQTRKIAL